MIWTVPGDDQSLLFTGAWESGKNHSFVTDVINTLLLIGWALWDFGTKKDMEAAYGENAGYKNKNKNKKPTENT